MPAARGTATAGAADAAADASAIADNAAATDRAGNEHGHSHQDQADRPRLDRQDVRAGQQGGVRVVRPDPALDRREERRRTARRNPGSRLRRRHHRHGCGEARRDRGAAAHHAPAGGQGADPRRDAGIQRGRGAHPGAAPGRRLPGQAADHRRPRALLHPRAAGTGARGQHGIADLHLHAGGRRRRLHDADACRRHSSCTIR